MINTRPPRTDILFHWLAIGDTHIAIQRATEQHADTTLVRWINEWELIDKESGTQSKHYLHTVFRKEPTPLSCSPDAGWLLGYREHRIVCYLEQDRNTSGVRSIAASKTNGYAELARVMGHKKHFPETTLDRFRVVLVTTHHGRRKAPYSRKGMTSGDGS